MSDLITGGTTSPGGPPPLEIVPGSSPGNGGGYNSGTIPSPGGFGVNIGEIQVPRAAFEFILYANGQVAFINKSIGLIAAYRWSFGDGTFSVTPNVIHQYPGISTYPVTLAVANARGTSVATGSVTVATTKDVSGTTVDLTEYNVDFKFSFDGLGVQFNDLSTNPEPPVWDLGDGSTSTDINPYHLYASNGIYTVTETRGSMSKTHQVVVDRGVTLAWQDNSSNETGFRIYHSLNGSDWTLIATTAAGATSLLVTKNIHNVDPSALNYFKVCATNEAGDSSFTNTVTQQCL